MIFYFNYYYLMSKTTYSFLLVTMIGLSLASVCRDGSTCPGTSTCCLTPAGVGCCPYENAYCCPDGLHCCPNGYYCDNNMCKRSTENGFSLFLAVEPVKHVTPLNPSAPAQEKSISVSDSTWAQFMRCISDIQPLVSDIAQVVSLIVKGDIPSASALIPQLTEKIYTLGSDCAAMFNSAPSKSVYLDVAFPSVDDILQCVSDIKPVVTEVEQIVNDFTNGDYQAAIAVLPKLVVDGLKLETDCAKIINPTPTPSVYLDWQTLPFPSLRDILECVFDVNPIFADFQEIVQDYKNGNVKAALDVLPKLVTDGAKLERDCAKIINLNPSLSSSVYLELGFPSFDDILKCISDIKPILDEVNLIADDLQKGDLDSAIKILPDLAASGQKFENDCKKLF